MRVSFDLELEDRPGQLLQALEPLSNYGANVISIMHIREKEKIRKGKLSVHFVIDVENEKVLEEIASQLSRRNINILRMGEEVRKKKVAVLIVGHVVDTDLRDSIDRINDLDGVMVSDMSLTMPQPEKESSALFYIEHSSQVERKVILSRLWEIAEEKELQIIRGLEV